jgi:DNA-binding NarL/FixJ family response regulator
LQTLTVSLRITEATQGRLRRLDSPNGSWNVLRVTGEGYSVAEIAGRLHLAPGTVRNYLSSAMQKTQTQTRQEAARYAREHDWL